jgi:hypothetical protein
MVFPGDKISPGFLPEATQVRDQALMSASIVYHQSGLEKEFREVMCNIAAARIQERDQPIGSSPLHPNFKNSLSKVLGAGAGAALGTAAATFSPAVGGVASGFGVFQAAAWMGNSVSVKDSDLDPRLAVYERGQTSFKSYTDTDGQTWISSASNDIHVSSSPTLDTGYQSRSASIQVLTPQWMQQNVDTELTKAQLEKYCFAYNRLLSLGLKDEDIQRRHSVPGSRERELDGAAHHHAMIYDIARHRAAQYGMA